MKAILLLSLLLLGCGAVDQTPLPWAPETAGGAPQLGGAGGSVGLGGEPSWQSGGAVGVTGGSPQGTGGVEATGGVNSTGGALATGGTDTGSGGSGGALQDPLWCRAGKQPCDAYGALSMRGVYWADAACTVELLPLSSPQSSGPVTYCYTDGLPTSSPVVVFEDASKFDGHYGDIWVSWPGQPACQKTALADAPVVGSNQGGAGVLIPSSPAVADPSLYWPQVCPEL